MSPVEGDVPVVLTRVATDIEAALLVAVLQENGIRSEMSGALASAFRAEAPGGVDILVHQRDLPRAREVVREAEQRKRRD
jgi:hypothetical protein